MMRAIPIWLALLMLTVAAPHGIAQTPGSKESESHEFHLRLPPGETFVVNFVINMGASVQAHFSNVSGIEAMGFAHPNSDLVEREGTLKVECPGLTQHPVKKLVEPPGNNMGIRAKQRGHYGMLWTNKGKDTVDLDVGFTFAPSNQVVFTGHNGAAYRR